MPENWNSTLSNARSKTLAAHAGLPVPVDIRPMRSARQLRLRYDDAKGVLKLTCPLRTSRRTALAWAADQRAWVDSQIAAASSQSEPFVPGALIPLEGKEIRLCWSKDAPRAPILSAGELHCGGTAEGFSRRIERFLKARALRALSAETALLAAAHGLAVAAVSIGDPHTRWGSCTANGRIRYNWRLILAPPAARRFVVAHEVAHLTHLNHGPAFKALETQLFGGDVSAARALLRGCGGRLKRIGRAV